VSLNCSNQPCALEVPPRQNGAIGIYCQSPLRDATNFLAFIDLRYLSP